jgi:hypothetical protein
MFADEVVAHRDLLAEMEARAHDRLAVQTTEHDSRFIVRVVDDHPHPFGFTLFVVSEFGFDIVACRVLSHDHSFPPPCILSHAEETEQGAEKNDETERLVV